MGHSCGGKPVTVRELILGLLTCDLDLEVRENWNESAGWFDEDPDSGTLWLGAHGPCDRDDNPDGVPAQEIQDRIDRARDFLQKLVDGADLDSVLGQDVPSKVGS